MEKVYTSADVSKTSITWNIKDDYQLLLSGNHLLLLDNRVIKSRKQSPIGNGLVCWVNLIPNESIIKDENTSVMDYISGKLESGKLPNSVVYITIKECLIEFSIRNFKFGEHPVDTNLDGLIAYDKIELTEINDLCTAIKKLDNNENNLQNESVSTSDRNESISINFNELSLIVANDVKEYVLNYCKWSLTPKNGLCNKLDELHDFIYDKWCDKYIIRNFIFLYSNKVTEIVRGMSLDKISSIIDSFIYAKREGDDKIYANNFISKFLIEFHNVREVDLHKINDHITGLIFLNLNNMDKKLFKGKVCTFSEDSTDKDKDELKNVSKAFVDTTIDNTIKNGGANEIPNKIL